MSLIIKVESAETVRVLYLSSNGKIYQNLKEQIDSERLSSEHFKISLPATSDNKGDFSAALPNKNIEKEANNFDGADEPEEEDDGEGYSSDLSNKRHKKTLSSDFSKQFKRKHSNYSSIPINENNSKEKFRIVKSTRAIQLCCKYRIVVSVDVSPSVASFDPITGEVLFSQIYRSIESALLALIQPIELPTSYPVQVRVEVSCCTLYLQSNSIQISSVCSADVHFGYCSREHWIASPCSRDFIVVRKRQRCFANSSQKAGKN